MDDLPKWVENLKIDVELCQEVTQGLEDLEFTTAAAQDARVSLCPANTIAGGQSQAKTTTAALSAARARSVLIDTIYKVKPSAFVAKPMKEGFKAATPQNVQCHAKPVRSQSAAENISAGLTKLSAVHAPRASCIDNLQSGRISKAIQQRSEIARAILLSHLPKPLVAAPDNAGYPCCQVAASDTGDFNVLWDRVWRLNKNKRTPDGPPDSGFAIPADVRRFNTRTERSASPRVMPRMHPLAARKTEPWFMPTPSPFLTLRTHLRLRSLASQRGSNANAAVSLVSSASPDVSWRASGLHYNPLYSMMSSWSVRHGESCLSWRDPDHLTDDDMADDASITDDDGEFGDVSSSSVNAGGAYYTAGLMMIGPLGDVLAQRIAHNFAVLERRFALLEMEPQTNEPPLE